MSRQVTPPQSQSRSLAIGSIDTPMSKKQSGFESHSSTPLKRDERLKHMALEISNYVVGPMPVSEFLDKFLRPETSQNPNGQKGMVSSDTAKALEAYITSDSRTQYQALLNGDQVDALQPICHKFEFRDTNNTSISTFQDFTIKPDICVFERGRDVDITQAEIMMELKSNKTEDPFEDERKDYFVKVTDAGKKTLGQTTLYAASHQAAQFRTHSFSVLVFREHARLLRWDRSGVIVTRALPILSPEFTEFFQLYDQATPQQRGIDTSASTPSPENASKARISLGIGSNIPLVQLSLGSSEVYIVSRDEYMNNAHSPLGRSTRTFIAYFTSRQCNVFLKDSWRLDSQTPEHEIYAKLRANNVPHLPTVLTGSDIFNQTTLTQDVLRENPKWIKAQPKPLRKHRHYRLILKEIATPLHSFSSTKILVSAIYDAIKAHSAAFKAGILHRDISSGNIMIYNNGGLLIDWDLSKSTQDKSVRESERTGTWQFISCRLLEDPTAVQTFTDDVESFIHVLTWVCFRYAKHNLTDETANAYMALIFDRAYYEKDGLAKGGDAKMNYLSSPSQLTKTQFDNPILKELLLNITEKIAIRYSGAPPLTDAEVISFLTNTEGLGKLDSAALKSKLVSVRQANHEDKLKMLDDSEWIINEFASVLKSPNWPVNDKARKYENTKIAQSTTHTENQPSSLKRKSSEDAGGKTKKPRALTSK